jgi:hypothetical protein
MPTTRMHVGCWPVPGLLPSVDLAFYEATDVAVAA